LNKLLFPSLVYSDHFYKIFCFDDYFYYLCISSKTCGDYGWINQNLKLSDREWTCKSCDVIHDRDLNASRNILKEGLKIFGQELSNTKVEDKSDVSNNAHSMKPEVQPIASGVGG
jgi:putative transposase